MDIRAMYSESWRRCGIKKLVYLQYKSVNRARSEGMPDALKSFIPIAFISALLIFPGVSELKAQRERGAYRSRTGQAAAELDSLRAQLDRLKAEQDLKLQELEKLIKDIKAELEAKEQEDELQKLLEEAAKLTAVEKEEEHGVGHRFTSGLRQLQRLKVRAVEAVVDPEGLACVPPDPVSYTHLTLPTN